MMKNKEDQLGVLLSFCALILLLICLLSCQPRIIEKTEIRTYVDTTYQKVIKHDTIKLDFKPNITVIDTNKVLINPFIASVDSLLKVGDKSIKLKASYNQKENKFDFDIMQNWLDSIAKIRQRDCVIKENTKIEYVNRLDWYMYPIASIAFIFAIVVGFFLNKFTK